MSKRIEFISFEEFQKLYKAEKDKTMKLFILLAYGSGLRISEIIGLQKELSPCCKEEVIRERRKLLGSTRKILLCSKCNKEFNYNNLRRKKGEWKIPPLTSDKINLQTHQIRLDQAKWGKWRVVVTPPLLREDMLKLLPISIPRRTIQYRFEKLSERTLGKRMSVHILRHGFGNYQANVLKLPLPVVQQMMGHSRLDTTGIYTRANPEESIKAAWKAMGGE